MTANYAAAIVEVEQPETKKNPARRNPRPLPPHAVVVENDDVHSFDYVVELFQKVFGYAHHKSFALTLQIHEQGRAIVWSGTKELAELKRDQIRGAAPDMVAQRPVEFPLRAFVEPLPG